MMRSSENRNKICVDPPDHNRNLLIHSFNMLNMHMENIKIMWKYMPYLPEKREQALDVLVELCDFMEEVLSDDC